VDSEIGAPALRTRAIDHPAATQDHVMHQSDS
jgi:hypothetical protein